MQKKTHKSITRPFDGIRKLKNLVEGKLDETYIPPSKEITFSGFKLFGTLMLAVILLTSLSSVGGTVAYFNDVEHAIANKLQVGKLFLSLSGGFANRDETAEESVGTLAFDVTLAPNETNLPMLYKAVGELDLTNPEGCRHINLKVNFVGFDYEGSVTELSSPATTTLGQWNFLASLPLEGSELASNAECKGRIVFKAFLAGEENDSYRTFSDVKTYPFKIYNWNNEDVVESAEAPEETNVESKAESEDEKIKELLTLPPEALENTGTTTEESVVETEQATTTLENNNVNIPDPEPVIELESTSEGIEEETGTEAVPEVTPIVLTPTDESISVE